MKYFCWGISGVMLLLGVGGCVPAKKVTYRPDDFINPNRIVMKTVEQPASTPKVAATFGLGNAPQVIAAYRHFLKKGIAPTINSPGFQTLPYSERTHPIVACAPLHLCVIQLEQGEVINNIDLGDSAHWLVSTALIGSNQIGSYQVVIKPKLYDTATDMVITTNKRTYNIGLVSQKGAQTHVVNFYYPQETQDHAIQVAHHSFKTPPTSMVLDRTRVGVDHLHFDYRFKGDQPAWRPTVVFDDGDKTFIKMPRIAARLDLPVLYILKNKRLALVNYRYRKPYYIVDALFSKAYLISGKGHHQERVEIDNTHFS